MLKNVVATCIFVAFGPASPVNTLAQDSWSKQLPGLGTFSSPRIADLNGDGVGDVILGAGREEFQACDSAIIALDGKTGELLWNLPAKDQVFGSAGLKDIDRDGILDVIISGRSSELQAVSGKTGNLLWKFKPPDKSKKPQKWFNFYNPQFVPDQNGDGLEDILISNGGDVMVEPYDPNRPAGVLAVLSAKDGSVISTAPMPDGRETYMSLAAIEEADGNRRIIFGTGGETVGGSLYVTVLSDVMKGDISGAIKLDSGATKGFIAPPAWVDITADGVPDVIANSVDGRLLAFDGVSYDKLWQVKMPGTEAYSSLSVGYFNKDSIPDFFVSFAQGSWPDLDWTKQFMVSGSTGSIEFLDSLGLYQTSTPVVADFNSDGVDDALVAVNYQVEDELFQKFFYTMLVAIDFTRNDVVELGVHVEGHNISSTPWIGDVDNDGNLDIVFCHSTNLRHTYTFDGMAVNRIVTTIPITKEIKWGAYMGSRYDGVFR